MKVDKGLYQFAEKIKYLRGQAKITQTNLAKKLNLTRASVNGWEMGLSVPSTPVLVEISKLFNVSTDYLLGLEQRITLNIDNLTDKEVAILVDLIKCFQENKKS